MDDPARNKSPEFFDETKPERNERGPEPKKKPTLFEEIFGDKKEREAEKLRKKLDTELKDAARKRAEDFEEEQRMAEQRDVAETRKLKKRWRAKLVEKSQREIDEAARSDQPLSGYKLAKLMVAEHIVRYQQTLDDEKLDLRKSERKALKSNLDFMGLLSEKLDRPKLEVPEEVEKVFQSIAASVEDVTGEDLAGSDLPSTPASPEHEPAPQTPQDPVKEAVQQRAEAFEEEQRVAEKRDVAETRKLKKRWRAKLVEKSQKILTDTEQKREPLNSLDAAKLVVAERIIRLHDMLENGDLKRSEEKTVKTHIDFMGLLSEKLDRPELEMPEEVETLYQIILKTVATPASSGEAGSDLPVSPQPETAAPPVSEADASYNRFASNIVQVIRRVVRPEPAESPRVSVSPMEKLRPSPSVLQEETPEAAVKPRISDQLLSLITRTALPSEVMRQEISQKETARRLADVVERAEILRIPTARPQTQERLPAQQTALKVAAPNIAVAGLVHAETESTAEKQALQTAESSLSKKKVKHMTDLELLTLAKTVTVAGGRLLSDVYTHGEIDREGLIKVLDSLRKGRDYRSEFTYRREKWRRHRENSPEYLMQPQATQNDGPSQPVHFPPKDTSTATAATSTTPTTDSSSLSSVTPSEPSPAPPPLPPTQNTARKSPEKKPEAAVPQSEPKPSQPGKDTDALRQKGRAALQKTRASLQKVAPQARESMKRAAREAREQLERQKHVVTLFVTMMLVILILIVVIELNFR